MTDKITMTLTGSADAIAAFKELGDFVRGNPARSAVRQGAQQLMDDIVARAPVGSEPHDPHAGRLQESFSVRMRAGLQEIHARIAVSKAAYYWRFVEFGHATRSGGHVAPAPFITPAVLGGSQAAAQQVIDEFEAAVARAERRAQRAGVR